MYIDNELGITFHKWKRRPYFYGTDGNEKNTYFYGTWGVIDCIYEDESYQDED